MVDIVMFATNYKKNDDSDREVVYSSSSSSSPSSGGAMGGGRGTSKGKGKGKGKGGAAKGSATKTTKKSKSDEGGEGGKWKDRMVLSRPSRSPALSAIQWTQNKEFWDALPDHEFFGPSVTHIYFYADVDDDSVSQLRQEVLEASRGSHTDWREDIRDGEGRPIPYEIRLSPKPIVIHVHSRGGYVWAGNWLVSLFDQVHVPICTMVDSLSASAATFLTVGPPYRVGTPYARSLLHDYAAGSFEMQKREELLSTQEAYERRTKHLKDMYLSRTHFTDEELTELMRHDKWLDADTCKKKGLYDRVLLPDVKSRVQRAMSKLDKSIGGPGTDEAPFFKTNWNTVYSTCTSAVTLELDALLSAQDATKPVIYTSPGDMMCKDPKVAFACIPRLQSFTVPVFGIVDNDLLWNEMLPIQYCHRRFMYDNVNLISNLPYVEAYGRLEDIVHNVNLDRELIVKVLSERAKPTAKFLDELFQKTRYIPAEECLRMGLVDEIIETGKKAAPPLPPSSSSSSSSRVESGKESKERKRKTTRKNKVKNTSAK